MAQHTAEIPWAGESGHKYTYYVYDVKTRLDGPGNFIFTKRAENGDHVPIFIGQTTDLNRRLPWPSTIQRIMTAGCTHLCAHVETDATRRREEETDLIAQHGLLVSDHPQRW